MGANEKWRESEQVGVEEESDPPPPPRGAARDPPAERQHMPSWGEMNTKLQRRSGD